MIICVFDAIFEHFWATFIYICVERLSKYNSFFMVGVGGISMSALALYLKAKGKKVCGSDLVESHITKKLVQNGIEVSLSFDENKLVGSDIVCFSGAIKPDDKYLILAKSLGIRCIERAALLAMVAAEYKNVIAVSGTHGKTTTTAMIANAFLHAGKKPTVHIGGEYNKIGGNLLVGDDQYFITEACEYRDSFLALRPNISVVTNVEKEHMDYFGSLDREVNSFRKFCTLTKGKCFVNSDYKGYFDSKKCLFFGKSGLLSKNESLDDDGNYSFDVFCEEVFLGKCKLGVCGRHNINNALACIAVCLECGIDKEIIFDSIKHFQNVDRRLENLGTIGKSIVYCDYAHHPTEIKSTLSACLDLSKGKKIVCVFQPHTFSRTRDLMDEFCSCFEGVSKLYLIDNYSARENYDYYGSAKYLAKQMQNRCAKIRVTYFDKKQRLIDHLKLDAQNDKIILFLGAGDIDALARDFVKI